MAFIIIIISIVNLYTSTISLNSHDILMRIIICTLIREKNAADHLKFDGDSLYREY